MHSFKAVIRWLFAFFFIVAGVAHFVRPQFYWNIMPPYLPWHRELVALSGLCEIIIGAAILIPRWTLVAAWGAIALLIAVFPANVHMALNAERYPEIPEAALWLRLPLQGVLIAWAFWIRR